MTLLLYSFKFAYYIHVEMWIIVHASETLTIFYISGITTKTKTHTYTNILTQKCKHVFAVNHDRYYSTVNCQSVEFHILHIP